MRALTIALTLLFGGAPAAAQATAPSTAPTRQAVVVVLKGDIDEYNKTSVFKRFEEARRLGASTVILQINTYGGLVTSGLDISRFIKRQNDLHVIGFVDEKAISAGAMVALACNEIVMSPHAQLGDCAPIALAPTGGLQELGSAERAKAESPILEDFYDSAKRNGFDPLLVQAMVSVGRVVHWVQNAQGDRRFVDAADYQKLTSEGWKPVPDVRDPVDAGDTLLTVGTDLAVQLGLASSAAPSPQALALSRGLSVVATLAPSGGESLIGFLSSMSVRAVLTTLFMFCLYMAFSHPGHGWAEALALISLGVLVGVPALTGYARWWEILAVLIGLVLIAIEVFVTPGFGVMGISGIVLVLGGLTLTWVGDEPIGLPGVLPKLEGTWDALERGLMIVVGGLVCSLALWVWLQRYLPRLPYFSRLILTTTSGEVGATLLAADTTWPAVGAVGRAMTDLRPGGSAAFRDDAINDDRMVDVVSDSGFVSAGTRIVVRAVAGNRVVVRARQT